MIFRPLFVEVEIDAIKRDELCRRIWTDPEAFELWMELLVWNIDVEPDDFMAMLDARARGIFLTIRPSQSLVATTKSPGLEASRRA